MAIVNALANGTLTFRWYGKQKLPQIAKTSPPYTASRKGPAPHTCLECNVKVVNGRFLIHDDEELKT